MTTPHTDTPTPDTEADHGGGDDPVAQIQLSLTTDEGVQHETACLVLDSPEAIAQAVVTCLHGLIAMAGPDTALAVTRRITTHDDQEALR